MDDGVQDSQSMRLVFLRLGNAQLDGFVGDARCTTAFSKRLVTLYPRPFRELESFQKHRPQQPTTSQLES